MEIRKIATYHGPFGSKFGVPRQSGLVEGIEGWIVFEPEFRNVAAVRGIEGFDYLWLIWEFSENGGRGAKPGPAGGEKRDFAETGLAAASAGCRAEVHVAAANGVTGRGRYGKPTFRPTVRPPRLGGNRSVGVFASRSPFRPNRLGLSSVRLARIDLDCAEAPVIHVLGADLTDGTPIYDIKPYVPYADSHPDARGGFVDESEWRGLKVEIPESVRRLFTSSEVAVLREALALDPRPRVQTGTDKVFGFPFAGREVKFRVDGDFLTVLSACGRDDDIKASGTQRS